MIRTTLPIYEKRTVVHWPKHLVPQGMSPTRPALLTSGVSQCWDWRPAHQKCTCFTTVFTGVRSRNQSETNLWLEWRRSGSRCKVHFRKHAATRRLVDKKRKSSQESDDSKIRIILGRHKEQMLVEAKSEILRHEYKADLAKNQIRALNRQIESHALEIGHTFGRIRTVQARTWSTSQRLADRERAFRHTRIGGISPVKT